MDGNLILSQFGIFTEKFAAQDIQMVKFHYDYDVFGSYHVVYRLKRAELTFNNDRGFLSITIRNGKGKQQDYFKLLVQKLNLAPFDCNSISEDNRLCDVISRVTETLNKLLEIL